MAVQESSHPRMPMNISPLLREVSRRNVKKAIFAVAGT